MSPACMATIFEGDNGGATSMGVTETEIRIGFPATSILGASGAYRKAADLLFDYFNSRFEFYGRRLVPIYLDGVGDDAATSRAVAADVAAQNVFAALTGVQEFQFQPQVGMIHELSRHGVVSIVKNSSTWWTDAGLFDPYDPYVWSTYPSAEDFQANVGDFTCSSLIGRKAQHAGDVDLRGNARKVAIVALGREIAPTTKVLERKLAQCTGDAALVVQWRQKSSSTDDLRSGFERLKQAGVTTVICACEHKGVGVQGPVAAHGIGYHPEWIIPPLLWTNDHDEDLGQNYRNYFGGKGPIRFGASTRLVPLQARPAFQAVMSVDAGFVTDDFHVYATLGVSEPIYDQFLLLASGLQAAGPILTPETFAQGLRSAQFPNPGAGQAPYWQPGIGFGPGDHSMFDDYLIGWWSDTAPALEPWVSYTSGSWCYVDQGARFTIGGYRSDLDDLLFNDSIPCR